VPQFPNRLGNRTRRPFRTVQRGMPPGIYSMAVQIAPSGVATAAE
jgi:hypothetical protein